MCGIAGIFSADKMNPRLLQVSLSVMNKLQAHRGPDGDGFWLQKEGKVGFAHRRLKIIDLENGVQPMTDLYGNTICFNGEIYNYLELKKQLQGYSFKTTSDTEVILAAYAKWGKDCVNHLRGMFAFALWDEKKQQLFCVRDRFGIKPFYYTYVGNILYFSSEVKALIPFLPEVDTDPEALQQYLVFQLCLGKKTLFKGVEQLLPGHWMTLDKEGCKIYQYWEVYYKLDFEHTRKFFKERLQELIEESVELHTRSDVPIGAYVSGGFDSGIIASVASKITGSSLYGFNGRFGEGAEFDEYKYAKSIADKSGIHLHDVTITSRDFIDSIHKVIYHLDYPIAGPGSFPQYHVSKLVSKHRKVVLGGQGGDEIFGGYTRYLIAYFEQCIKAAIDGTSQNGNFVVTYESIIPNLIALKNYKPLLKDFWKEGLFEDLDKRYYRLINRAPDMAKEVKWDILGDYQPFETFKSIFHGKNVGKESYFDAMTHFDFKTLLPALLQVEDRMSMAHGVEARVPFLDHPLVEFAATMPSDIKFKDGTLKMILVNAMHQELPENVLNRKDKMGFPVPLNNWLNGELKNFFIDIFSSQKTKERKYFNHHEILNSLSSESKFGRKIWGLLSLELWFREFHDKAEEFKNLMHDASFIERNALMLQESIR